MNHLFKGAMQDPLPIWLMADYSTDRSGPVFSDFAIKSLRNERRFAAFFVIIFSKNVEWLKKNAVNRPDV